MARNAGKSPRLLPTSGNFDLQKAKEQLLQSIEGLARELHEHQELANQIRNEKPKQHFSQRVRNRKGKMDEPEKKQVCDVAEVVKDNDKLNLAERVYEREKDKITELKKETDLLFKTVDYLMQSAEGKSIEAPELTQFTQEFRNDDKFPGLLPTPANLHLQSTKRNMAAALDSSTENLHSVNEALKSLTLMDGDGLVQSSEGKSTQAPELTQFPQEFRNAVPSPGLLPTSANLDLQKAKEQLLQSIEGLARELHEHQELANQIRNEKPKRHFSQRVRNRKREMDEPEKKQVCDVAEVVKDNDKLNLAERVYEREKDKITELKKETDLLFKTVDYLMQSAEGKSIEALELTQFTQEFRNDDKFPGLLPTPANLHLQKPKQHYLQRVRNRKGKMDEPEKKQEEIYIVTGKFHGDSFADQ